MRDAVGIRRERDARQQGENPSRRASDRLGIKPPLSEATPFYGIRFLAGELWAETRFISIPGLGIRRTILHSLLVDRAATAGVVMGWGVRVNRLHADRVSIGSDTVTCKWITDADGHNSRVRCLAGLGLTPAQHRIGISKHYRVTPWDNLVEVYQRRRGHTYVTPIARLSSAT